MIVDTVLMNARAYVKQEIVDCSLALNERKIFRIGKETSMPKADAKVDLGGLLVLPGLIDVHVHLRDEGKAYKEDFYTGTASAAIGGITSVLDMPNNDPVTMSAETLRNRMEIAKNKILVNVGFYSEFPWNTKEIGHIVKEGAIAFKLFMGEQVGGLELDDEDALSQAFRAVGKSRSSISVHAEDKSMLKETGETLKKDGQNDIAAFLEAHSEDAEVKAVEHSIRLAEHTKVPLHICHTSTEKALNTISKAKNSLPVTCEVTPHHLFLSSDDLRRLGTIALGVPPLRKKHDAEALWRGIKNGMVDVIASDHAPHTLEEKNRPSVWDVKVGMPELEVTLSLLLTEMSRGKVSIMDIVRLMAENPAKIFGLKGKGILRKNASADLTVVDLKQNARINAAWFYSKAKFSPFDGWKVKGKPVKTFVGGQLVMDEGEIVAKARTGSIIRREQ